MSVSGEGCTEKGKFSENGHLERGDEFETLISEVHRNKLYYFELVNL